MRKPFVLAFVLLIFVSVAKGTAQDHPMRIEDFARGFDRGALARDAMRAGLQGSMVRVARCGTRPVSVEERAKVDAVLKATATAGDAAPAADKRRIGVYVHVIHKKNGKGDVSETDVEEQIAVLNAAFRNRGFRFVLKEISRTARNKWFKKCSQFKVEDKIKRALARNPELDDTALDVYLCDTDDFLGYAWFPWDWPKEHFRHGVVALYSTLPNGSAVPYHLGNTVVHEVGHWLGLYHTFQGGCAERGDRVAGTPGEQRPAFGCPVGRDTCPAEGDDPVDNFMDYSDDECMEHFTRGQGQRMKDSYRAFLR